MRFPRGSSREEILDADILIKLRPVDPFAPAYETPLSTLRRGPMGKAWVPLQRHRYRSPIDKIDD